MKEDEFLRKVNMLGVPSNYYSLNGDLLPFRMVVQETYGKFSVFYFSERGTCDDMNSFESKEDALDFLYNKFSTNGW